MVKAVVKNKSNKKTANSTKKPVTKKAAPVGNSKSKPTTKKAEPVKKPTPVAKKVDNTKPKATVKKNETVSKTNETKKTTTPKAKETVAAETKTTKMVEQQLPTAIANLTPTEETKVGVLKKVVDKAKNTLKNVTGILPKNSDAPILIEKNNKTITPKSETMQTKEIVKDVVNILNSSANKHKEDMDICPNCHEETTCKRRQFSEQALAVLLLWGEIQSEAIDVPICDDCYNDMRGVLIDRVEEIESALKEEGINYAKQVVAKIAS